MHAQFQWKILEGFHSHSGTTSCQTIFIYIYSWKLSGPLHLRQPLTHPKLGKKLLRRPENQEKEQRKGCTEKKKTGLGVVSEGGWGGDDCKLRWKMESRNKETRKPPPFTSVEETKLQSILLVLSLQFVSRNHH